jgi:hypothetical protein
MDWIARMLDAPLGWLLDLPRDLAIALVAVGTSLLLTLVRKWTTNQDRLCRAGADVRRLRALLREAKREKDRGTVRRLRTTLAMVRTIRFRAEGLPLLVSIVPIALLALWAVQRLDYLPARPGQDVTVRAYYPIGSVEGLTHLIAPAEAELPAGAVRQVAIAANGDTNGVAEWTVRPAAPAEEMTLKVRHRSRTVEHTLRVGGRTYLPPVATHGDGPILATEVMLHRAKFLGIVPGIDAIGFPPWLVAYLILTIALVPVSRWLLRVQ